MILSLNEVEGLARKAARGAGYPWGIAEEAGKAVRWLCALDVNGCAAVADYLSECDPCNLAARPLMQGRVWSSNADRLCPLFAGAALCDLADHLTAGEIRMDNVASPIILAPFAATCARQLEKSVHLEWQGAAISTDGHALVLQGVTDSSIGTVTIRLEPHFDGSNRQRVCSRADPGTDALRTLDRLAHRTYAPATEASRLSGAGAGLADND